MLTKNKKIIKCFIVEAFLAKTCRLMITIIKTLGIYKSKSVVARIFFKNMYECQLLLFWGPSYESLLIFELYLDSLVYITNVWQKSILLTGMIYGQGWWLILCFIALRHMKEPNPLKVWFHCWCHWY